MNRRSASSSTSSASTVIAAAIESTADRAGLAERAIDSAIYYPVPLHRQRCFAELGLPEGAFPEAERAAGEALSLPVHPDLSPAQIEAAATAVREILG